MKTITVDGVPYFVLAAQLIAGFTTIIFLFRWLVGSLVKGYDSDDRFEAIHFNSFSELECNNSKK